MEPGCWLGQKPVALFGSYDWGTRDWMDAWKSAAQDADVNVVQTVIANLEPGDDVLEQLCRLGNRLAQ